MQRKIVAGAVAVAVAVAATVTIAGANHGPAGSHLTAVGPSHPEHGYPAWYRDANNVTLDPCIDQADPLCIVAPIDTTQPMTFPTNFPDELFYSIADATIPVSGGGRALFRGALEGAFINGAPAAGDQIVFGRIRIRIDNLIPGQTYTVTHPYGSDTFVPDAGGVNSVNFTEDVGAGAQGDFTAALNSRVGPFLRWNVGAPAGYLGDPNVEHRITGSAFGTNVVRIEGPGVGELGSAFLCPDRPGDINCVQTDLFRVMGRRATVKGLDVVRATYTRDSTSGSVNVFASSDTGQALQVLQSAPAFHTTRLAVTGRSYMAHVALDGAVPPSVSVANVSDDPPTVKTVPLTDEVTITQAEYDTSLGRLRVVARSSDAVTPPTLTAVGLGALNATGARNFVLGAPPPSVTVTSPLGGSATRDVTVIGPSFTPVPVVAHAGIDQDVQQTQIVRLDGTLSTGDVATYQWSQVVNGAPAVTLTGADTATPTFTAPSLDPPTGTTTISLQLTVTGPGGPSSDTVLVTVLPVAAPIADAGRDQTVPRASLVSLDGRASTGAASFNWTQTAGPAVTLVGADTSQPHFSFPQTSSPLTFQLVVSGPGGVSAPDFVTISPQPDVLTVTAAEFRQTKREWRVTGTASIRGPGNRITIHIGGLTGPVLGVVDVDALGNWQFRVANSNVSPDATRTLSLESTAGGTLTGVRVTVRQ